MKVNHFRVALTAIYYKINPLFDKSDDTFTIFVFWSLLCDKSKVYKKIYLLLCIDHLLQIDSFNLSVSQYVPSLIGNRRYLFYMCRLFHFAVLSSELFFLFANFYFHAISILHKCKRYCNFCKNILHHWRQTKREKDGFLLFYYLFCSILLIRIKTVFSYRFLVLNIALTMFE